MIYIYSDDIQRKINKLSNSGGLIISDYNVRKLI